MHARNKPNGEENIDRTRIYNLRSRNLHVHSTPINKNVELVKNSGLSEQSFKELDLGTFSFERSSDEISEYVDSFMKHTASLKKVYIFLNFSSYSIEII